MPNGEPCETNREFFTLMVKKGMSPRALARKSGVSHKTIELVIDGWIPSARVQGALATQLGVDPDELWSIEAQLRIRAAKKRART